MPRSRFAPIDRLRVKPAPSSRFYVEVLIFESLTTMHNYGGCKHGRDYRAVTVCYDGPSNRLCEVRLCRRYLHPSLVAHELLHAAMWYLTRLRRMNLAWIPKGEMPYDHPEEVLCRALQRMLGEALIKLELVGLKAEEPTVQ